MSVRAGASPSSSAMSSRKPAMACVSHTRQAAHESHTQRGARDRAGRRHTSPFHAWGLRVRAHDCGDTRMRKPTATRPSTPTPPPFSPTGLPCRDASDGRSATPQTPPHAPPGPASHRGGGLPQRQIIGIPHVVERGQDQRQRRQPVQRRPQGRPQRTIACTRDRRRRWRRWRGWRGWRPQDPAAPRRRAARAPRLHAPRQQRVRPSVRPGRAARTSRRTPPFLPHLPDARRSRAR